ncbi:MAG: hypothetical protein H7325_04155 [Pedobacter sp.]|nr:hypothetical protein [Pedobacter sp.]
MLNAIDYFGDILKDLKTLRNFRPHLPKGGNLKSFWSIDVGANDRIFFRFVDGNAYDLNYLDSHKIK